MWTLRYRHSKTVDFKILEQTLCNHVGWVKVTRPELPLNVLSDLAPFFKVKQGPLYLTDTNLV